MSSIHGLDRISVSNETQYLYEEFMYEQFQGTAKIIFYSTTIHRFAKSYWLESITQYIFSYLPSNVFLIAIKYQKKWNALFFSFFHNFMFILIIFIVNRLYLKVILASVIVSYHRTTANIQTFIQFHLLLFRAMYLYLYYFLFLSKCNHSLIVIFLFLYWLHS